MNPDDVLLFGDECGIGQLPTVRTMWALKGQTPVVQSPGGKKRQNIMGAVCPATGVVTSAFIPNLTATIFLVFLKALLRLYRRAGKIYLVIDNARSHHAKLLQPFLKAVAWKLELIFLPPYSPDFNPIEDFWKLLREKITHNTFFERFDDMVGALRAYLGKCKQPNEEVRSRCRHL